MGYFTTRKTFLVPSFDLDVKEEEKLYKFLGLLEASGVAGIISSVSGQGGSMGGRPAYSPYDLFATVLYGFAFGSGSVRDLEESCRYDLRYIYLMQQERPSYSTFSNFINNFILPNCDEIFYAIAGAIASECGIAIEDAFIDGTKFEADANRYKFVWKPTCFHERLSEKIRSLLSSLGLQRAVPSEGIIDSRLIASKLTELSKLVGEKPALKNEYGLLREYLEKTLEYEEKERICGPDRNSYYKTDHDATGMCLKDDYYAGLGSSLHAAYNSQIMVSKGLIVSYLVTQSRSDIGDFIGVLEKFRSFMGYFPKRVCADAGYGSLENYSYLETNHIENFVKYFSWEGNVSGRNPDCAYLNGDGTITCLNGNVGQEVEIDGRHPKSAGSAFFMVKGCSQCGFSAFCKRFMKDKNSDYKIFEISRRLYFYKQQAETNLLSTKGIEMRVNRSSQVENAFGVIKQDMRYDRLRRTSIGKAGCELMLTYVGYDVRKLFRHFSGKASFSYWVAPPDLKAESFKKPSAKKLSNKARKIRLKSVNEEAKSHYKYK